MADDAFASSPEIWKPVPGHEGYEVSSRGRVRSLPGNNRSARVLRQHLDDKGYARLHLGRRHKRQVHRLVLLAFRGPPAPGEEGAHLDGDPGNNRLENLAWKTSKENKADQRLHGTLPLGFNRPNAKLTDDDVRKIRLQRAAGRKWKEIERDFPFIHRTKLILAATGGSYSHIVDVPPFSRRLPNGSYRRFSSSSRSGHSAEAGPS